MEKRIKVLDFEIVLTNEERVVVDEMGKILDKVGLIYITDNCFPDLVVKLRGKGKLIFGHSLGLVKKVDW